MTASLRQQLAELESRVAAQGCYLTELPARRADPIRYELLNSKLVETVTSAHEVARLVSASPMTRELGEVIFGLYTAEGDAIVLSRGLLIHVHTMSLMIKWMIRQGYQDSPGFAHGDYYFNNDPYIGGAHCPDQMIVTPIMHGGRLIAWAGGLTHSPETGSSEPGGFVPFARSRFEEGLFLPCVKIAEHDELKRDLEVLVERSVRSPVYWLTDNRAKMTGTRMIRDQVGELIGEFGAEYFDQASREYIEDTYRAARRRVQEVLAPGRYREVSWRGSVMPGEERLLHGPVELTVHRDGHLEIDFTGLSPAGRHPFQGTLPTLEGLVMNVIIQHLFYDLKHNEGVLMATRLTVPEGSAGNPPAFTYPTALWGITYGAGLAAGQALSRAYYARGYREEAHATSALSTGYTAGGTDHYGRPFGAHNFEFAAAGLFATAVMDGLDTAGVEFNPEGEMGDAEIWEQIMPPVYLAREIHVDGGGFGRYRGGNGVFSLYLVPGRGDLEIGSFGSAPIFSAPGLMGGYPAGALYMWVGSQTNLGELIDGQAELPAGEGEDPARPDFVQGIDARWELIPGANRPARPAAEHDVFTAMSGDGGGFGDPLERDPATVAADLANQVTTRWTAEHVYGVHLDATGQVDAKATQQTRAQMRADRLARAEPADQYRARVRRELMEDELPAPTRRMYQDVLAFCPQWRREFLDFWQLPEDWQPRVAENEDGDSR
ncbi:MAG TPA: hydantoinase B/oxoprolinase family protein [Streptosporangiaceae bacterium]|jgi:acetone carboxylase alpha subunit